MNGGAGSGSGGGFGRTGGVRFSSGGGVPTEFFKMFHMEGMGRDGFGSFFEQSHMGGVGGAGGSRKQKFKFTSKAR